MSTAIIGIAILVISITGALLLAARQDSGQQRQTKILLFLLYFWLLAFVQLIIASVGYWAMTR
jgi:hypothetical protein